MGLTLWICPRDGRLPTLHPSWRNHHRVTWEMLPVKVSDQFYQRLSNWEGPTGVTGKVHHALPWTSHPTLVIPHAHLCVDHREAEQAEAGG